MRRYAHPCREHCFLDAVVNGVDGHDQSADDDSIRPSVDRSLPCVESKAVVSVSQVFDVRKTRSINVLYSERLGKKFDIHTTSPLRFSALSRISDHENYFPSIANKHVDQPFGDTLTRVGATQPQTGEAAR